MTIERLIDCSADELEAMSDAELLEHFKQYLDVTRPERAPKQINKEQRMVQANPKLKAGLDLAKSLGIQIDMSALTYRKGKK